MANLGLGVPEGSRARTTIKELSRVVSELQTALKAKFGGYAHVSAIIGADPKWSIHVSYDQGTVRQHATKIFRGEDGSFDAAADAMRAWLVVDEVALGYLTLGLSADGLIPSPNICPNCKRDFPNGGTCSMGGCPMGGDF